MSTLKVNELDTKSGTTITVAAGKTLAGNDIIGAAQIATDAVTADAIAANAVDSSEIAAGAVTNVKTDFQPGTTFKGDGSSADGKITLNCSQNTHGVSIQSPTHASAASYTLTLPTTDGNADEFMQTNGSGVLTWAAPAADIVKIASGNLTGAGTISIDGHFSSTYLNYRIIFDSILTDTDDSDVNIRVNTSGSADTSSNYTYASARTYINSGSVSAVDSVKSGWNQDKWLFDDGLEDDNKPAVVDLMIYNPQSTAVTKVMMCDFWNLYSSGTQFNNHRVGMNWNLTTALTGVTIYLSSGNFETSTDTSKNNWTLYGYKN